jgi:hypothetical protein
VSNLYLSDPKRLFDWGNIEPLRIDGRSLEKDVGMEQCLWSPLMGDGNLRFGKEGVEEMGCFVWLLERYRGERRSQVRETRKSIALPGSIGFLRSCPVHADLVGWTSAHGLLSHS